MQVEPVFLGGVLGVCQRRFQDLDDLVLAQLLAVVLDEDRARERVGLEIVDSQHAHELALDGLAELGLAVDDRILQPQPPGQLVLDLPVRDDRAIPEVANLAFGVADRGDRGDGNAERLECSCRRDGSGTVFTRVPVGMHMPIGSVAIRGGVSVGLMTCHWPKPCGD